MTQKPPMDEDTPSFNALVLALDVGDCVSKVRKIDSSAPLSSIPEMLPGVRQQVRSACAPAIARAKLQTGGTYSVEVGDTPMPGGNYYVVAVVTRNQ